jgi:dephospho-CoA kinase
MGKSAAHRLLTERGISAVDTDELARDLVEPGQPALEEIRAAFGAAILDNEGRLRRGELARVVFQDAARRKQLEEILHPRIRALWQKQIEIRRAEGRLQAVVVIPLLFETEASPLFDSIVCVACSGATQRQRLQARGWSARQIQQRIKSQWPVEKKMELANSVIWTEGPMTMHAAQLERVFA